MSDDKQHLKQLYQALQDRSLDPAKPADFKLYVPYVEQRQQGDPVEELIWSIDVAHQESLQLVSGQKGTGKSTQLKRLKKTLEANNYHVFYVDMLDYLVNNQPVDVMTFLLAAIAGLAQQAKNDFDLDSLEQSYWQDIRAFFSADVVLNTVKVAGLNFDVKQSLKYDSQFKQELRKASQQHIAGFKEKIDDFLAKLLDEINPKLAENNKNANIVFIVDSFEKIRGGVVGDEDKVYDSIAHLFGRDGIHLHLPKIHFIITVPPYLTTLAPGVAGLINSDPINTLPSLHVRDDQGQYYQPAIDTMLEIVRCRSTHVDEIFSAQTLRRLALASGGDLRQYFNMLRTALRKAGAGMILQLPINDEIINQAENTMRRELLPITDQDVEWLHNIHNSHTAELKDLQQLPSLARLFDAPLVISYQNGHDWYDIHPLVMDYVEKRMTTLKDRK